MEDLDGRIDLVLDGGATTIGVESTVLNLTGAVPTVLRPGAVTIEMLREVLGRVDGPPGSAVQDRPSEQSVPMPAPGMLERHYSPRAALTLYEGAPEAVIAALIAEASALWSHGKSVGIIAAEEDRSALADTATRTNTVLRTIGPQAAPEVVASRLYSTLRELDAAGVDAILVRGFPDDGLWAAVKDRLRRAAGRIVRV
jgi:L-threonylcarbamoyladenylate synthase